MQTLELNKMGLAPMQTCEMQEARGGSWLSQTGPIILLNSIADFWRGVVDGDNAAKNS